MVYPFACITPNRRYFQGFAFIWRVWVPPFLGCRRCFAATVPKTVPFAALTEKLYSLSGRLKNRLHKRGWLIVGGILLAVGLWRSDWRDDIRQWVNMPTAMLTEVQQIGQLSGTDFGGKYLVAEAQAKTPC